MAIIEKVKSLKQYPKYLAIGAVVFFLGLLFHFPLERFGSSITSVIKKNSGWSITAEKISFGLPIGIVFTNVQIQPPDSTLIIAFDQFKIRPAMALHFQKPFVTVAFKGYHAKQVWSGSLFLGSKDSSIDFMIKNFDFKGTFPLPPGPINGQVDVDTVVDLDFSIDGKTVALQQQNFSEANGSLEIKSKKTNLIVPMLQNVDFTNVELKSELKKGVLNFKKIDLKSSLVSADGTGEIKVEPFFPNSKLQLNAHIEADMQNPNVNMIFPIITGQLGLPPSSDGKLSLKINGPLNSPERLSISGS